LDTIGSFSWRWKLVRTGVDPELARAELIAAAYSCLMVQRCVCKHLFA
jgi:hypothetical protein